MCRITSLLVIASIAAGPIWAQDTSVIQAPPHTIDRADLEAFLDGVVSGRMENHHIAGVTVSLVHRGEMVISKGYGFADVKRRIPVEPATTLFRPGSISKTITWTAVMQLVERGKLDLETDIRTYLDEVEIPDNFPEAITMLDLMAHAPGFEDSALGHLFGNDANNVMPLKEYLIKYQPARVRPPGQVTAYSNYGTGLAGLIVSNVSGLPFEDYVEQNIFDPLGMNDSTFREPWENLDQAPMPANLAANSSVGYTRKDGDFVAGEFEFIHQVGPAGALSTTATDMARYMLMHLGQGSYDGAQILEPDTAKLMHTRHFAHDDAVNGWAHGLIEYTVNGYRGIGHSGGTLHFLSQMVMVPELDFGIFASANTEGGLDVVGDLQDLVVARYFPPRAEWIRTEPPADFADRAARYVGTYTSNRRNFTMLEKVALLFFAQVDVTATGDGYLVLNIPETPLKLVEVSPLVFREVEEGAIFKFLENEAGEITGFISDFQDSRMDRTSGLDAGATITIVALLSLLACVGILIAAWYRRRMALEQSTGERLASIVLTICAITWLTFFAVFGTAVSSLLAQGNAVMFEFPTDAIIWSLAIAIIGVIETLISVGLLIPIWTKRNWCLGRRIRHTLAVAVFVELVFVLLNLNMIGFKYF